MKTFQPLSGGKRNSLFNVCVFILLTSCFTANIFAQTTAPEKNLTQKLDGIQTSSKELVKSASTDNSSVGQSGVMSTSVPLVQVSSRTMSFPIKLSYASGIKVDQKSGPVGLGWQMPIGSITRDYGAYEPDYTSTLHEGDMKHWNGGQQGWLNPNGGAHNIHPGKNSQYLGYDALVAENQRQIPLSDFYHMNIPGMGSNTFWNNGLIGGSHDWRWNEFENWKINHDVKTYVIDQEFSRVNEANLNTPSTNDPNRDWFPYMQSYASAIGVFPYVKNGFAKRPTPETQSFNPIGDQTLVKYEDFESFSIIDDNGKTYVFGRALRGQKFVFQDDPYWSALSNDDPNAPDGSFWKVDFIAEWLLTEIRSPDYVDLNVDGIANDGDAGDWIRFEYTESTKTIGTIPYSQNATLKLQSEVPTHREWSSYSQTDQASSLMRERAYLTKIVTPVQEVDFTISQRFDVDHDFYSKPANKIGTDYFYENRKYGTQGLASDFDIIYPVETMKYDAIKVNSRLIDESVYVQENVLAQEIVFNYALKGSANELAVSDYLIRNNNNEDKLHDTPSTTSDFNMEEYNDGTNKRGKTTLLGIDFLGGDQNQQEKTSCEFEYAYNPSFNEIHKREIIRAYSSPSTRSSGSSSGYPKSYVPIEYTESILGVNGMSYSDVVHSGIGGKLHPNDFLIDIPFEENHYKLNFPNSAASTAYAITQQTGTSAHDAIATPIAHDLNPIKDVYGYLYANNCTKCPEAWSLTKITYPTGGQVSFEYEQGSFDLATDQPNWNISENNVPIIKEYNELAKQRSYVQDAYNQYAASTGGGFGANNSLYKTLTATFEVNLPTSYGIRLKKKTISDRINPTVEIDYNYTSGHFTSLPSGYVQAYVGAFNQFIIRERSRHKWEQVYYGPGAPLALSDFENQMSYSAVRGLSLDEYHSTHFYERIDKSFSDSSVIKTHYGMLDGSNTIDYLSYNLFCYRLPGQGFGWDGRYILARENLDQMPVMPLKTEMFDAGESTPYKSIVQNYSRFKLIDQEIEFDYTAGLAIPNTVNMWNLIPNFNIWLPIKPGYYSGTYTYDNGLSITIPGGPNTTMVGFGHIASSISSTSTLPYNGVQDFSYERWGSYKTFHESTETNYKGILSTTEYEYNGNYQINKKIESVVYPSEEIITTYEYAHETYSTLSPNPFWEKNMLSNQTKVNVFVDRNHHVEHIDGRVYWHGYTIRRSQ